MILGVVLPCDFEKDRWSMRRHRRHERTSASRNTKHTVAKVPIGSLEHITEGGRCDQGELSQTWTLVVAEGPTRERDLGIAPMIQEMGQKMIGFFCSSCHWTSLRYLAGVIV